jgi:hypothetical protein
MSLGWKSFQKEKNYQIDIEIKIKEHMTEQQIKTPESFWVLEGETEHGAIRRAVPTKDGRVIEIYDGEELYDSLAAGDFLKNVLGNDPDWKLVEVKRIEQFQDLNSGQTQALIDGIEAKIKTYLKFVSVSNDSSFYLGRIDALQDVLSDIKYMTRIEKS